MTLTEKLQAAIDREPEVFFIDNVGLICSSEYYQLKEILKAMLPLIESVNHASRWDGMDDVNGFAGEICKDALKSLETKLDELKEE